MKTKLSNKKSTQKTIRKINLKIIYAIKSKPIILFLFILLDLSILCLDFLFIPPLKINATAPKDIIATRTIIYRDEEETERIKNLILSQFKPIYSIDQNITLQVLSKLSEIFTLNPENPDIYRYFSTLSLSKINIIRKGIENWVIENYTRGIKQEELDNKRQEFIKYLINDLKIPRNIALELSNYLVIPNSFINIKETENKKSELIRSIKPIERIISRGEIILRKGERVTKEKFLILDALGYTLSVKNTIRFLSLFSLIIVLRILTNLINLHLETPEKNELNIFLFVNSLFSATILISKIFSFYSVYLSPITTILFITLSLLNFPINTIICFSTILISFILLNSPIISFLLFLDFFVIYNKIKHLEDRSTYIRISFILLLLRAPLILIGKYAFQENYINYVDVFYSIINPIFSAILAIGLLPSIEDAFRLASSLKLFELTNPNYPLLKKLLLEAPGTYYHSLIVGNLAERAAEESGANQKVVRTASLYHDIGKIKRPQYFIENLLPDQTNPHDKLSPYISVIIIKSHPKDGASILNRHKFPKSIIDIVEQHHGTSLITYFYAKQKQISNSCIPEEDFRYQGPKPKSKEAAIVMLADSVEAATRSLKNITPENIEKVVRDVIKEKINDGQLENSKLTLEELEKISQSFIKTLIEVRHPRVPYPQEMK